MSHNTELHRKSKGGHRHHSERQAFIGQNGAALKKKRERFLRKFPVTQKDIGKVAGGGVIRYKGETRRGNEEGKEGSVALSVQLALCGRMHSVLREVQFYSTLSNSGDGSSVSVWISSRI